MNVETESIWFTTGNPFVDSGQEMMAAMADVDSPNSLTTSDVQALLPRLINLYFQEGWVKSSRSIFPNSPLHNGNNRRERYTNLLNGWLRAIEKPESLRLDATCAVSGYQAQVYLARMFLPMSDREEGNFQSGNEKGMPLSASVALALQFFPLGLVWVGKMLAFPHFSNDEVRIAWANQRVDNVFRSETLGIGGVQSLGISRPVNAFFKLVENLVRGQKAFPNSSATLYLFNNYNQASYKNAAELHYMPSPVFRFISAAMGPTGEANWRRVVRRGFGNAKNLEGKDDEGLRNYTNRVYSNLLKGESISAFFLDRRRRCPAVLGESGWRLCTGYLKEVGGMDQRRIDSLRNLGDRIAPLVRERRRRLLTLEGAGSRGALTDVLYRISKDAMSRGYERPLITFDQLITDIFPHDVQYNDWREVKYLLLFRIYEQLFDELKGDPKYANAEADQDDQEGEE